MTIKDLVMKADSVFPYAFLDKALLIRTDRNEKQSIVSFNLKKAFEGDPANNILLQNLDSVVVYTDSLFKPYRNVEIFGQVRKPGQL